MKSVTGIKQLLLITAITCCINICASAQSIIQPAPAGFDTVRAAIAHGMIDTIVYSSATVGNKRKSLIYTPPGYTKKKQ